MSITKRLALAFGLSLIVSTCIGLVGYFSISSFLDTTNTLVQRDAAYLKDTQGLKIEALQHRRYEKDFFLNIGKPEKQAKYLKKFSAVSASLKGRLDRLANVSKQTADLPESAQAAINAAQTAYGNYHQGFLGLSERVLREDSITPQQANKLMGPIKDQIYAFENSVDELVKIGTEHLAHVADVADQSGRNAKSTILACLLVGFLMIIALAYLTIHRIRFGLTAVSAQLAEISSGDGDLTQRLDVKSKDEIGHLSTLFNDFLDALQQMIRRIGESANVLATSTVEVSNIATQLSDASTQSSEKASSVAVSTEEVNANTNSIASAMEEAATNVSMISVAAEQMQATVNEISQHTASAKNITGDAVHQAQGAGTSINELSQYSEKIGKVTEVITEISEQTNLLALNATIEAARAGEAGKGFAVVANEIKELARQTADATQDIKQQIGKIQVSTKNGVKIIEQISSVVGDVDNVVTTIAAAVEEQSVTTGEISANVAEASQGIQEINQNVAQSSSVINDITHEIDALSRSSKANSDGLTNIDNSTTKLHQLSEDLKATVGRFKV